MADITFQRKELYDEVWSTPLTKLAEKYGISNYRLSKICEKLEIPTPKTGYWSKIKHGKKVTVPALPESDKNSCEITTEPNKDYIEDLPKPIQSIVVKKQLRNLHPLAKKSYEGLSKRGWTCRGS